MPDLRRRSTLRTALRIQEDAGRQLAFKPGGWIELALAEDETSPFPEDQRLYMERLRWICEAINSCPEPPAIRSNWKSPDPTARAHECLALPPLGFIAEAKVAGPALWGRPVQVVKDGVGQMEAAIADGFCRGSLGFLAGIDPEGVNGWSMDHWALMGTESSGQRMLGVPPFETSIFRTRGDGEALAVSTRALDLDEPEPAVPAAEGGSAAEEDDDMPWTPEERTEFATQIAGAVRDALAPMLTPPAAPEPTAEERAAAEAATAAATERAAAWTTEVTDRLDRCVMDRRLSSRDRPALITSISTMGREKGEPELRTIEARTTLAPVEPLHTSALSERNRSVLAHLPAGVRIDETNIDRTLSYVAFREKHGLKPGQKMTADQARELLALRSREQAG